MDNEQLLIEHREFYGHYHQHKEQLAYGATVLYLAGTAAILYTDTASLNSHKVLKILFAVLVFLAAIVFVTWQLRQRQVAADVVEACERLLARRGPGEVSTTLSDPRVFNGLHMPHFIVDELIAVGESRKTFAGPRISGLITYLTILAAAGLAVARMAC